MVDATGTGFVKAEALARLSRAGLVAVALTGCALDAELSTSPRTTCEIDEAANVEGICGTDQAFVYRCPEIKNPGGVDCNGPVTNRGQQFGSLWCCK